MAETLPPEAFALLETIAGTESAGRYDVIYGGQRFTDFSDHPRVNVTIRSGPNKGRTSSAAGKYQFLGSTWDRAKDALNLPDFSPESQDRAAWWLAQEDYEARTDRDLLPDLRSGDPETISRVGRVLAPTWTSLPSGIEQGQNGSQFLTAYSSALTNNPVPPGNIPDVATQTDVARVAPIPANPADRPLEPYQVPPRFPSLDPSNPATAAIAGFSPQTLPPIPPPGASAFAPTGEPEWPPLDLGPQRAFADLTPRDVGPPPSPVPPMPTDAGRQSYAGQERSSWSAPEPAADPAAPWAPPLDIQLLQPNAVTPGLDYGQANFIGTRATLPNGQATLGADSFAGQERFDGPAYIPEIPQSLVGQDRFTPPLADIPDIPQSMVGEDRFTPARAIPNIPQTFVGQDTFRPEPSIPDIPQSFAGQERFTPAPTVPDIPQSFVGQDRFVPYVPPVERVMLPDLPPPSIPPADRPQSYAGQERYNAAPYIPPATLSETGSPGIMRFDGQVGNAQMPADYRPVVTVPDLPEPGNTGPMDSVGSAVDWADFEQIFGSPETRILMADPMRSELDQPSSATRFSASDMARGKTPKPQTISETVYDTVTERALNPEYTKALKNIELYNYVPPDIKMLMNFTPDEMADHKERMAAAERARAAPLPEQYITETKKVPRTVQRTIVPPIPAATNPVKPKVVPPIPPAANPLAFDLGAMMDGAKGLFAAAAQALMPGAPINQAQVRDMAQAGLLNKDATKALKNDDRSYVSSGGAVIPTVAMNGQIRNSYGDGQFGGATSGSLG